MAKISSYKDLEVWKKSMSLVTEVYSISHILPAHEIYGLVSQMRRAACSIPLNIAEGWGRSSTKNYIYSLRISKASLMELENCLIISLNLKYISSEVLGGITTKIEEIVRMLNSLIKSLTNKMEAKDQGPIS